MKRPVDRYSRQVLFTGLGSDGQQQLSSAAAAVVGLGALGTVSAGYLARAGVGRLRLVDRDLVELSNLQRQVLFDEQDARLGQPKAEAAAAHLRRVNSGIEITAEVADLTSGTIDRLLDGMNVVIDGTDNFETRFLINEWCARQGIPWVYGAAVGAYGLTFPILPGETPCLACVFEEAPPPELSPTCDTAGVLGPLTGVIGSLQAGEAIKILAGRRKAVSRSMLVVDLWTGEFRSVVLERRPDRTCPVCDARTYTHLDGAAGGGVVRLCGRNAVQVSPVRAASVDIEALARRLEAGGDEVSRNPFLVRARVEGFELTVFRDGRTLVTGTEDTAVARSLVARYVGA